MNIASIISELMIQIMKKLYLPMTRAGLAIVFFWFGILKPLGLSPAEGLLLETTAYLPIFKPEVWLHVIGYWEVLIGILFLFRKTTLIAIVLLAGQMFGAFMPLFLLPEATFSSGKFGVPTLEGQYIIKNILIIAGAMTIGAHLQTKR